MEIGWWTLKVMAKVWTACELDWVKNILIHFIAKWLTRLAKNFCCFWVNFECEVIVPLWTSSDPVLKAMLKILVHVAGSNCLRYGTVKDCYCFYWIEKWQAQNTCYMKLWSLIYLLSASKRGMVLRKLHQCWLTIFWMVQFTKRRSFAMFLLLEL